MRTPIFALLLLALLPCPAMSGNPPVPALETVLVRHVEGDLELDRTGHVERFTPEKSVPAELAAQVSKAVLGWRFEPVVVDGTAVKTKTRMRVTLRAEESEDRRYVVYVENVTFPGRQAVPGATIEDAAKNTPHIYVRHRRPAPAYPSVLENSGISGDVLVQVRLTPEGKVAAAHVVQSALIGVKANPQVAQKALAMFERAALSSAKQWTYGIELNGSDPAEPLGGYLPFAYRMEGVSVTTDKWRRLTRTPLRPAPWKSSDEENSSLGVADLVGTDLMSATSLFKLANDVRGQAL